VATSMTRNGAPGTTGPVDVPEGSIGHALVRAAEQYHDREAVSDDGVSLDFPQLAAAAADVAAALLAVGVQAGDRVVLWAPNSHHWIRIALGVYTAGAVLVPVNTRYRAAEARELVRRTGARIAFVHDGFLGYGYRDALVRPAADGAGGDRLESVVDLALTEPVRVARNAGDGDPAVLGWDEFVRRGQEVSAAQVWARLDEVGPGDLSDIVFTSGTTGRSKGVRITHGPAVRLYTDFGRIWGLRPGDRHLLSLPMFHAGGLKAGILACLLYGVTAVPMAVFDTEEMIALVEREKITALNGPPTVHYALLDHPAREQHDLSSLRLGATGAAVVPIEMVRRVQRELTYENFITAYGLTECIGTATMCRRDDSAEIVATSNGRAVAGVELRIVGPDGRDRPVNETGEVLIRGYQTTAGYWDSVEETAGLYTEDGWLRTGDAGRLDEQGNLAITDRIKDLFMVGGFNVAPAEVEHFLREHPAVADVAVVGVPDARLGEVGRAFVILRPDVSATAEELISWCGERMANFKVPRSIVFVDSLPRTPSGKVVKVGLRDPDPVPDEVR
jgi:acyl-CoA synthetase (AMP-forming)/AMP-acid ligase II